MIFAHVVEMSVNVSIIVLLRTTLTLMIIMYCPLNNDNVNHWPDGCLLYASKGNDCPWKEII